MLKVDWRFDDPHTTILSVLGVESEQEEYEEGEKGEEEEEEAEEEEGVNEGNRERLSASMSCVDMSKLRWPGGVK